MITKEQIIKHCNDVVFSKMLFATLDHDYQAEELDYILPEGTIVQLRLCGFNPANLYVNNELITPWFPYDAATLLEE